MNEDELGSVIVDSLQTWNVVAVDVQFDETGEGEYEAAVDIAGELLLDDVLDDQGTLLYNREVEVHLTGFRGDRVLLQILESE